MIRRNISDGLDMVVHREAADLELRESIRTAFILFSFAVIWLSLAVFALAAAVAVFPSDADGPAVDALTLIFNVWPLPSIGLGVLSVALCFKFAIGQLRASGE